MKKYLFIFFSFFYFIAASGVTLNLHYCGGELKTVSLLKTNEDGCCGADEEEMGDDGCCKNTTTLLKISDTHKAAVSIKFFETTHKLTAVSPTSYFINNVPSSQAVVTYYINPPSVTSGKPLYLKNRVLII